MFPYLKRLFPLALILSLSFSFSCQQIDSVKQLVFGEKEKKEVKKKVEKKDLKKKDPIEKKTEGPAEPPSSEKDPLPPAPDAPGKDPAPLPAAVPPGEPPVVPSVPLEPGPVSSSVPNSVPNPVPNPVPVLPPSPPAVDGPGVPGPADEPAAPVPVTPPPAATGPSPIKPLSRFGGLPTMLSADSQYLYAGFGPVLNVYDTELNAKGSFVGEAPIVKVIAKKRLGGPVGGPAGAPGGAQNGLLLFVQEEANNLELVSLLPTGELKSVKVFEAEGPFELVPDSSSIFPPPATPAENVSLIVWLSDRIKKIGISDEGEPSVLVESMIGGLTQVYPVGAYFYAVAGNDLIVLDGVKLNLAAKISIGSPFRILSLTSSPTGPQLVLALIDASTGRFTRLMTGSLVADGSGLSGFGPATVLTSPLEWVVGDSLGRWLSGRDDAGLYFYDPQSLSLIGAGGPLPSYRLVTTAGDYLYGVNDAAIVRQEVKITAAETGGQTVRFENEKKLPLPRFFSRVLLPGGPLLAAISGGEADPAAGPVVVSSKDLAASGGLSSVPFTAKGPFQFERVLPISSGYLLYDAKTKKIFHLKGDLSGVIELKIPAHTVLGMDWVEDAKGAWLYLAVDQPEKKQQSLLVYGLDLAKGNGRVYATLPLPEAGGIRVIHAGAHLLAANSASGLTMIDLGTPRGKMKELGKTASPMAGGKALDVVLSPNQRTAFVLYQAADGSYALSLYDVNGENPTLLNTISNLPLSPSSFAGLTFSAGGKSLLLPQTDGLAIYDVSNPSAPQKLGVWNVGEVFWADVTNRGQTVCVALGPKGIECGNL